MEFILALALLTFWAIRIGSDSAKNRQADIRIENMKMDWERWKNRVKYTDEEEARLRESVISPSRYGLMKQNALNTIRSFYGLEYACFECKKKYGEEKIRTMVKFIESVKKGKLPSYCYERVPVLDEVIDLHIPRTARIEFGQWIERTMHNNGVFEAKLYVQEEGGYTQFVWEPYLCCTGHNIITKKPFINIPVTDPEWMGKMTGGYSDELCEELNAPLIERNKARQRYYETFKQG